MVFSPPEWVPKLEYPPDSCTIGELLMTEKYGRVPFADSKDPFTCGISGKTFTNQQQQERVDLLARGISHELGWEPNQGREWDKVMGVFSFNTIDYMNVCYAVHRLNGVITPANAAYSAQELEYQLKSAGAKGLVTCMPLLETALQAAQAAGIPKERVYITDLPKDLQGDAKVPFKNLDQLIEQGRKRPPLEELKWTKGQGATQTAFLCYSSGTSGLPKGVMISHRNVISNVLQINTFDRPTRLARGKNGKTAVDVSLGLLPMSHIYGLVVGSCAASYAGDQVIILPKFEMATFLSAVQNFKINILYIVPPIIIQLVNNDATVKKYDMSSVRAIFTGAAPLGAETAEALQTCHPGWKIRQGYGLTETCTVVCSTPETDIHFGTAGSLLPGYRARLLTPEGTEITGYNQPGELVVQSPSVVIGYLNNDKANRETFIDDFNQEGKGHLGKWMRTGDEAMIVKSNGGNEHIVITDRIKELIKVKGMQVAPAELEAHILAHPSVFDVAVIGIPDDMAGEVPKAFVVKAPHVGLEESDKFLERSIIKWVQDKKARHKWLKGGVEFVDVVPKSPSGKILRRLLRDQEKAKRAKQGPKL